MIGRSSGAGHRPRGCRPACDVDCPAARRSPSGGVPGGLAETLIWNSAPFHRRTHRSVPPPLLQCRWPDLGRRRCGCKEGGAGSIRSRCAADVAGRANCSRCSGHPQPPMPRIAPPCQQVAFGARISSARCVVHAALSAGVAYRLRVAGCGQKHFEGRPSPRRAPGGNGAAVGRIDAAAAARPACPRLPV